MEYIKLPNKSPGLRPGLLLLLKLRCPTGVDAVGLNLKWCVSVPQSLTGDIEEEAYFLLSFRLTDHFRHDRLLADVTNTEVYENQSACWPLIAKYSSVLIVSRLWLAKLK